MRKAGIGFVGGVALSLVAATATLAQQSDRAGRKSPRQTVDKGVDDPATTAVDTSQIGERTGVTITLRADGVLVGALDESFHDAIVATKNADGSISYACVHGLPGIEHAPVNAVPSTSSSAPEEK